ncbi:PQQ-dependent sugar dehydrogenase [Haloarchaeobius iranensis]|uniref:Tat (Twin-arginine translocation) pathway signal sequence n=1 Tax=Haloarchaeobius iranensis TaxID=996166 RepID=A0A1G9XL81_9EURY|nr:PQQ-dependent sugar dehydrogenase [Haloarchaeobius iranensis]SDM97534.1 Tat (twin-arginine translocation) pathway signal sequence [Haloarchaeobius iranensis]
MAPNPPSRRQFLAAAAAAGLAGCLSDVTGSDGTPTDPPTSAYDPTVEQDEWPKYDEDWEAPTDSPLDYEYETEVLVENLDIPWDISFTGEDELFLTERTGTIRRFESGEVVDVVEPDEAIDAGSIDSPDEQTWWVEGGEGGLLGVAAHPDYPEPPLVYAYYTYMDGGAEKNKVSSFDASADDPSETVTTLVEDIPGESYHDGGRIAFGPEGHLWVTTGDGGTPENSQSTESLGGKVLRITAGGDPVEGNAEGGDARIFSLGHRNPQTITWLPDATPVVSEHGQTAQDEVSLISPGWNGGWPEHRTAEEYPGSDYNRPVAHTGANTSWAPSGGVFYTGDSVPGLQNRLLVGGLWSQRINVVTLSPPDGDLPPVGNGKRHDADWLDNDYVATSHHLFEDEFGRIRHVEQGPNGDLYFITCNRDGRAEGDFPKENDDRLVRVRQV